MSLAIINFGSHSAKVNDNKRYKILACIHWGTIQSYSSSLLVLFNQLFALLDMNQVSEVAVWFKCRMHVWFGCTGVTDVMNVNWKNRAELEVTDTPKLVLLLFSALL